MLVSEAVTLLKHAELKQLAVRNDPDAILGFINLGVLELHKRFPLWESEAGITQTTGVLLYSLDGEDPNVQICMADHDIQMIQEVYDEDDNPYEINNDKDPDSLYTPQPHKLRLPSVVQGYRMSVVYKATPKFLKKDTETVPLPPQFIEALFLYVAYKAHISIKSGVKDENNTHFIRFESSCNRITLEGVYPQKTLDTSKLHQRCFP